MTTVSRSSSEGDQAPIYNPSPQAHNPWQEAAGQPLEFQVKHLPFPNNKQINTTYGTLWCGGKPCMPPGCDCIISLLCASAPFRTSLPNLNMNMPVPNLPCFFLTGTRWIC